MIMICPSETQNNGNYNLCIVKATSQSYISRLLSGHQHGGLQIVTASHLPHLVLSSNKHLCHICCINDWSISEIANCTPTPAAKLHHSNQKHNCDCQELRVIQEFGIHQGKGIYETAQLGRARKLHETLVSVQHACIWPCICAASVQGCVHV